MMGQASWNKMGGIAGNGDRSGWLDIVRDWLYMAAPCIKWLRTHEAPFTHEAAHSDALRMCWTRQKKCSHFKHKNLLVVWHHSRTVFIKLPRSALVDAWCLWWILALIVSVHRFSASLAFCPNLQTVLMPIPTLCTWAMKCRADIIPITSTTELRWKRPPNHSVTLSVNSPGGFLRHSFGLLRLYICFLWLLKTSLTFSKNFSGVTFHCKRVQPCSWASNLFIGELQS